MIRAFLAIELPDSLRVRLGPGPGGAETEPRRRALGAGGQYSPDLEILRQRPG